MPEPSTETTGSFKPNIRYIKDRVQELRTDSPETCWRPSADWRNVCILSLGHAGRCGWDDGPIDGSEPDERLSATSTVMPEAHHPYCSAANHPCPLKCHTWTRCSRKFFPRLAAPESLCPTCSGGPCVEATDG